MYKPSQTKSDASAIPKHSPLDTASERLSRAFTRLESVVSTIEKQTGGDSEAVLNDIRTRCEALETEMSSISEERERLTQENVKLSNQLQALQKEHLKLQKLADEVADRIDDQVKQLDLIALTQR